MVDLQNISIMITAISVTIAAIYYTTVLRINQRNSKIALTILEFRETADDCCIEGFRLTK